jgi:glycerate kinase
MKVLIAPNAFKGSLSSPRVAQGIARGLARSPLDCEVDLMPIADGGDDTLEALCHPQGHIIQVEVEDPLGRPLTADLGFMADGRTAVVEMARASGLKLLAPHERNPLVTSTYGVGQLMTAALARGAQRIIVGAGGSATVDAGAGCLSALGIKLLDASGDEAPRGGGGLAKVDRLDTSGLLPGWDRVEVLVACDVENPALGPEGSAAVYGPQKGASPQDVAVLEAGIERFLEVVRRDRGLDLASLPKSGAAGALAAGLHALAGARLESGIELILDHLAADERVARSDLVITGEGRLDSQTLSGKGPQGLATIARQHGRPVVALVGSMGEGDFADFAAVLPITPGPMDLETALARAEELVEAAAERLGRLLKVGRKMGGPDPG